MGCHQRLPAFGPLRTLRFRGADPLACNASAQHATLKRRLEFQCQSGGLAVPLTQVIGREQRFSQRWTAVDQRPARSSVLE
jgi:hypothetical protein